MTSDFGKNHTDYEHASGMGQNVSS